VHIHLCGGRQVEARDTQLKSRPHGSDGAASIRWNAAALENGSDDNSARSVRCWRGSADGMRPCGGKRRASWPGLSRPSTWFGATNDQKRVTQSEGLVLSVLMPVAVVSVSSLRRRGVDSRDKPGHDGRRSGAPAAGRRQQQRYETRDNLLQKIRNSARLRL
jgi:hypothetical protein